MPVELSSDGDPTIDRDVNYSQIAADRLAQEVLDMQPISFGARGITDVTKAFTTAAEKLQPGQLVKDEYFTLFEAVGALEIMDPKMDSGYIPVGDTFEPDFDPCQELSPAQTLWIMDELFRLEIAWLGGYPLSQTVFTSLHVDRLLSPDNKQPYNFTYGEPQEPETSTRYRLVHTVMRAYCFALSKCWQQFLGLVQSQNFYEEEDFVTHLFGRDLLPKTTIQDAMELLDDASVWVEEAVLSPAFKEAFTLRLQFRLDMLAALDDDSSRWVQCLDAIKGVQASHDRGDPLPDAFSDKVQRKLATSTPPRPMLQLTWEEACKSWSKLCNDMIAANNLTSPIVVLSPQGLQRATWAFAYRSPPPNALARAHMQNILFGQDLISDTVSHMELFLADLRDVILAGHPLADPDNFQVEMISDPRHLSSRVIESFMEKAFDEYLNLYRMVCQNRCRIRRTFTQAIPILDELETEALKMDDELNDIVTLQTIKIDGRLARLDPLSNWTKHHKLRIVTWTIQLGFETNIYLPDEMPKMYWMLLWYTNSQHEHLRRIEGFVVDRMKALTQSRKTQQVSECLASQDWLRSQIALNEITHLLSEALWRLFAMLVATRAIKSPQRASAEDELLWEARMKPFFGLVNDPVPSLEDFGQLQAFESIEASCQDINRALKAARSHLAELKKMEPSQVRCVGTEEQWKAEIKQLETTCVSIVVQTSQILRIAGKSDVKVTGKEKDLSSIADVIIPEPGTRYHDWWVVPQIKEK